MSPNWFGGRAHTCTVGLGQAQLYDWEEYYAHLAVSSRWWDPGSQDSQVRMNSLQTQFADEKTKSHHVVPTSSAMSLTPPWESLFWHPLTWWMITILARAYQRRSDTQQTPLSSPEFLPDQIKNPQVLGGPQEIVQGVCLTLG